MPRLDERMYRETKRKVHHDIRFYTKDSKSKKKGEERRPRSRPEIDRGVLAKLDW